ncbi:exodeoxyribonuclease V subunit gamma [Massilia sp. H-1]|nr:exodeoxyribonuclease V subunit gamma [Massilia sp. H-1]
MAPASARSNRIRKWAGSTPLLARSLAQLIEALLDWRARLAQAYSPAEWGQQARALLAAFFDAGAEEDRLTLAQLNEALQGWLETCDGAWLDEPVPLAVLREAWLGAIDEPTLNHQFVSGGVTFCTLMPMRAVPFRVVCLLGMNDGDFPRRAPGRFRPARAARHGAPGRPFAARRRPLPDARSGAGRARQTVSELGRTQCARQQRTASTSVLVSQLRGLPGG